MEIPFDSLSPGDRYRLLIRTVVPRPIAMVSTISPGGVVNVAPFSFFNAVAADPPTLLFCPGNRLDGGEKDTLRNVRSVEEGGTGEFVVNVSTEPIARQVAAAAEDLPYGESELDLTGLTTVPGRAVAVPRLAEAPVAFECRTGQILALAPGRPAGGNVVFGEILHVHVHDSVLDEKGKVDPARLRAIGRMGGLGYCSTRDHFAMPRGRAALEGPDPFGEE